MQIQVEAADLKALVDDIVGQVVPRVITEFGASEGQLAFDESAAAQALGVPRHTLRDARLRGELVASRIGKRIVYRRDELLAYLERNQLR